MNSSFNYRPGSILPTAQNYPSVSVGELSSLEYQTSIETLAEDVSSHLEAHPDIPGVVLIKDGGIHSVLPRGKMFERLGHRFGVELFLRKPIVELQENIETTLCMVSSNTRISAAANIALGRSMEDIYDPLVVKYDNGSLRLLDMHVLLMAQSVAMENINNIISNINRIEQSIKADIPLDASLDMIIDAIKRTTPHHRAAILIKPDQLSNISSHHDIFVALSESINSLPLIKSVGDTGSYVHIEDTSLESAWKGMEFSGNASVWIGLPIASGGSFDGVLALSRMVNTPFSKNEIDMAATFAEFLSVAINRTAENHKDDQFIGMIKRKFIY